MNHLDAIEAAVNEIDAHLCKAYLPDEVYAALRRICEVVDEMREVSVPPTNTGVRE